MTAILRTLAALHLDLILRPLADAVARLDAWLCDYTDQGDL